MSRINPNQLCIRKTAVQLNIPESIIEIVIGYKWKSLHEAQYLYTSLEDSGLGTFKVRPVRVIAKLKSIDSIIDRLEKQIECETNLSENQIERKKAMINELIEERVYLENKL